MSVTDMQQHLILFDCDGTLVDSHAHIVNTMQKAMTACQLSAPDDGAVSEVVGLSLERAVEVLIPDEESVVQAQVTEHYRRLYLRPGSPQPLFPGVRRTLDELAARGYWMGIVTGKSRRGLARVMDEHDLHSWVMVSRTPDECPSKPHPDMVTECADEMGMDVGQVTVVGDACFDIEMALSAGAQAIGVSYGAQSADRLREAGAGHIVDRFEALLERFPPLQPINRPSSTEGIGEYT
ncbi:MAG TPA: HAD-IA family hydrolase [Mariprofundaceae bacterium]|nr:HAD-IA family hydrolase [Mariprofundaceae bacterium]